MSSDEPKKLSPRRERLHEIIFEADTPVGRAFDVSLLWLIVISVGVTMIESVPSIQSEHRRLFVALEWVFTIVFAAEYFLRLYSVRRPARYARSFFGIIDLVGWLPTVLSVFLPGAQYFTTLRVLRVMRVFRVLKLAKYLREAHYLAEALRAGRRKITVFLLFVITLVTILGSLMYVVEGQASGFTSIPQSIYWAVVTLTTVGYGDVSPVTPLGKFFASFVMILGYAIIAIPTGIVSSEFIKQIQSPTVSTQACPSCGAEGHSHDALYCRRCGSEL